MNRVIHKLQQTSAMKILTAGYCSVIFLGTILLSLPVSINESQAQDFANTIFTAFFTATSATCVTGLVLVDTWTHWTSFGHMILLFLMEIGGLGFMTLCIATISTTHIKIGMSTRLVMQNSISAPNMSGIVRITRFALKTSLAIQFLGMIPLSYHYIVIEKMSIIKGIWYGLFHSISAFCNAGFDVMGCKGTYSSLSFAKDSVLVNVVVMFLIIVGGLGFFVWTDLISKKFRFKHLSLHSKIVITTSAILIVGGGLVLFFLEKDSPSMEGLSPWQKAMASIFQSVTARTAGFNTIDIGQMSQPALFVMMLLMMVGGSPGSTAGGIKTTTLAVLILSVHTTIRRRKSTEAFGRRMEDGVTRTACSVFMSYLILISVVSVIISSTQNLDFLMCLFDTVSAIATVGLTSGVTSQLTMGNACLLAFLMMFGRIGSITVLQALFSSKAFAGSSLPQEKIQIG